MDFTSEASGAVVAGATEAVAKAQSDLESVLLSAEYFADLERIGYVLEFVEARLNQPGLEPNEALFYKAVKRKCIELDTETREKLHDLWEQWQED